MFTAVNNATNKTRWIRRARYCFNNLYVLHADALPDSTTDLNFWLYFINSLIPSYHCSKEIKD